MPQLLIELLSEEIPARMQTGAARDFERLFAQKLTAAGLTFESLQAHAAPRRLTLVVEGLPSDQAATIEEVKGPRITAPEAALDGFLRKVGLTKDQLKEDNGVWFARIEKPGLKTLDVLPDMLRDVLLNFPWPKSMRSGTSSFRWVRPLKSLLFLFDGEIVPFELEGIVSGNTTSGHRFLSKNATLTIENYAQYINILRDNFVILLADERKAHISREAEKLCSAANCSVIDDQGLLEEVAGLNEYPVPLLGEMDARFLSLPPEVIRTSMRTHQKYFAVRDDATGKMSAHFLIVANMKASDGGGEIKRGNAKVLSARLSDGVFFWSEDNKSGNFERWSQKLKGVTFHASLGTMAQRVERIAGLASQIAPLFGLDPVVAERAARLSKADLASYMVGEFPELQGVMGGYYAEEAGFGEDIAEAIRSHYRPQGPSDSVPERPLGACVALADKLDTLIGFYAIGEKPTGSKDPFALRRSALGILRILRHHSLRVDINELVAHWYRTLMIYAGDGMAVHVDTETWRGSAGPRWRDGESASYRNYLGQFREGLLQSPVWVAPTDRDYDFDFLYEHVDNTPKPEGAKFLFKGFAEVSAELLDFFAERLRVQLREDGIRHDVIDAVFAIRDGDVVRQLARVSALSETLSGTQVSGTQVSGAQSDDLLGAHRRAANILAAEGRKGMVLPQTRTLAPDAPEVEKTLFHAVAGARHEIAQHIEQENYSGALQKFAALRQSVDAFLDGVLVNAEDPVVKAGRLRLLTDLCALTEDLADLSKIV